MPNLKIPRSPNLSPQHAAAPQSLTGANGCSAHARIRAWQKNGLNPSFSENRGQHAMWHAGCYMANAILSDRPLRRVVAGQH
jgi:hypothetical protein